MSKKNKLIDRFKTLPKDFTFEEAESLLEHLSYTRNEKGKTSGSRVEFESEKHGCISLHRPHPQKEMKEYQVKQLYEFLEKEGLI